MGFLSRDGRDGGWFFFLLPPWFFYGFYFCSLIYGCGLVVTLPGQVSEKGPLQLRLRQLSREQSKIL